MKLFLFLQMWFKFLRLEVKGGIISHETKKKGQSNLFLSLGLVVACLPFLGSALTQVILGTIWNICLLCNMVKLVVCTVPLPYITSHRYATAPSLLCSVRDNF
jgi:hypothetical protein